MTVEEMLNTAILSLSDIQARFMFMGEYDSTREYQPGDIVVKNGEMFVYNVGVFESLGVLDENNIDVEPETRILSPLRCKCCGGTLIRYGRGVKCEYCDTEYA